MNTIVFLIILNVIHALGTWKIYKVAGKKVWHAFIPLYNIIVLLKIINRPWWWIFLIFVPVINVIIIPVIWVEISRSFGKNSFLDTCLCLITIGGYNYYLNYFDKLNYIENRSVKPKTSSGEWISSIIFAIIAATFVHTYFIQPYTIPTSSLEKTLLVGDFLFVSKFHYGARVPMTPIAAPMVHDSIPFTKGLGGKDPSGKSKNLRSYLNKEQLPLLAELPYLRIPGFQKIKRNDIVCFNWPVDTLFNMLKPSDKSYYKPIDKKTNYVKRAVGVPGDTLEIIDGYVYINGRPNNIDERARLQFSQFIEPKNFRFSKRQMINYDITDDFFQPQAINNSYNKFGTYFFFGVSKSSSSRLKNDPNVKSIKKAYVLNGKFLENDSLVDGVRDLSIFPHNKNFNWNNSFFGPIVIPKKDVKIEINLDNLPLYKRLIDVYENNSIEIVDGKIFINDLESTDYTFKQDYYWLMGDNRDNSQDSRSWGFVPFDHVVGKPIFKWLSIDYNASGFDKIRWERLFTTVQGNGKPKSYFLHFVIIVIFWYLTSKFIKKKRDKIKLNKR